MLTIFSLVRRKKELFISRRQFVYIKFLCYIIAHVGVQHRNQRYHTADKIDTCLVVNKYDIHT